MKTYILATVYRGPKALASKRIDAGSGPFGIIIDSLELPQEQVKAIYASAQKSKVEGGREYEDKIRTRAATSTPAGRPGAKPKYRPEPCHLCRTCGKPCPDTMLIPGNGRCPRCTK